MDVTASYLTVWTEKTYELAVAQAEAILLKPELLSRIGVGGRSVVVRSLNGHDVSPNSSGVVVRSVLIGDRIEAKQLALVHSRFVALYGVRFTCDAPVHLVSLSIVPADTSLFLDYAADALLFNGRGVFVQPLVFFGGIRVDGAIAADDTNDGRNHAVLGVLQESTTEVTLEFYGLMLTNRY